MKIYQEILLNYFLPLLFLAGFTTMQHHKFSSDFNKIYYRIAQVPHSIIIERKRIKNKWSALKNMGENINTDSIENCPTISPDGKYFFFMRYDGKKAKAYWVRSEIINELM